MVALAKKVVVEEVLVVGVRVAIEVTAVERISRIIGVRV
jgi:hypothetical protein